MFLNLGIQKQLRCHAEPADRDLQQWIK